MTTQLAAKFGVTEIIGSHRFETDEIIRFASRYDPQPFHLSEDAARRSQFGRLCASGWHTASTFMRLTIEARNKAAATGGAGEIAEYGPSPGFRDLRWLKPVYAGDTITYSRTLLDIRPSATRPGWSILNARVEAHNQDGAIVMECISTVLVRVA